MRLQEVLKARKSGCAGSVRKLTTRLRERGFSVGHMTIWALLKRMDFSLKTSVRKRRGISPDPERRDEQFPYIASQRKEFCGKGLPVISVDAEEDRTHWQFQAQGAELVQRGCPRSTSITSLAWRSAWRSHSASMTS